jgi:hypothetical protein
MPSAGPVQSMDVMLAELRAQTRWLQILAIEALAPRARAVIKSPSHLRVYELTDGARTTREIAAAAGVGAATVSRLWSQWAREGLVAPSDHFEGRSASVIPTSRLGATEADSDRE